MALYPFWSYLMNVYFGVIFYVYRGKATKHKDEWSGEYV